MTEGFALFEIEVEETTEVERVGDGGVLRMDGSAAIV
jgi:hypothetical protein